MAVSRRNWTATGQQKNPQQTVSATTITGTDYPQVGDLIIACFATDNLSATTPDLTSMTVNGTGAIGTVTYINPDAGSATAYAAAKLAVAYAVVTTNFVSGTGLNFTQDTGTTEARACAVIALTGQGTVPAGSSNTGTASSWSYTPTIPSGAMWVACVATENNAAQTASGWATNVASAATTGGGATANVSANLLTNITSGYGGGSDLNGDWAYWYAIIPQADSPDGTFTTSTGNASASGGTGSMYTPNATFSATTASSATASGGSGALRADKTLTTTTGNANAAGNSGSFTGTGATRTWRNYATNVDGSGSDSTPTFSVDIGSASSDRWVVVAIVGREPSWTDITVNGTSLPNRVNYGGGQHPVIIAWGLVTTGSGTVTVAVNTGGTPSASWAMSGCWTITGAGTDLLLLRDADGASTNDLLTTAGSFTLTTVAGDFIFGGTNCLNAGANATVTWSQGTKRSDFNFGTQSYSVMDFTADGSTEVIQATHAEGITNPCVTDAALYFAPQANATLTTSTGNANAAGNQGSMGVISFLTTTVGNANAAGNQGSMYGVTSATLTTTTGNASAAGGVGFMAASDPPLAGTGQGAYTLRVIDGSTEYELPDYQTVAMGYEFSDTGSVKIAYRKGGINADRLTDNAIVVARWNGVEKPNSRWRILAGETDDVAENAFVTHTGLSLFDIFRRVVVIPAGGAASITFSAASPGAILDNLFDAAQARGAMTGITWDFTGTVDSSATAWAKVVSIEYKAGVKYIDIIRDMITKGMLEARFTGYEFEAFNADGLGTTTTVELIAGKDYRELPRKWSSENRIKFSLALGDENTIVTTTDNTITDGPFGREEGAVSQGGTADTGTLTLVNNAAIAKYKEIREQLTRKVVIRPGGYVPVIDYQVADYIRERVTSYVGGSIRTASQQYRLRSIVVELGADGQIGEASITLNDQFLEDQIRLARRVDGIIGGPTGDGGGNGVPTDPVDVTPDETVPNPPTGVVIDSAAYNDGQGKPRSLMTIGWNAPTQNTNATQLTDLMDYEVQVHKSTDTDWTTFTTTLTNYALSNLDPGTQYYVRVRARDTAETMHVSTWAPSDTGQLSGALEGDTTPPAVPSQLSGSIKLTVPTLIWNGLNSTGGGMDADFDYCWLHRSTTSGFTPSTGTRIGKMWPGAYTAAEQGYGTPYYYKLTAVDTSGNESAGNTQFSLTATKLVDTDLAQAIIDDIAMGVNAHADAAAAQSSANAAQTTADGKNKVTYSANAPGTTANTAGDIWFQQTANEILGQWVGLGGTSWQSVTLRNEVIATLDAGKITTGTLSANRIAANSLSIGQVNTLQTALDSKAPKTWVQPGIPTSTAIGELWVDTDDSNKTYIARMVGADQITAGEWELLTSASTDLTKTWVQASIPTATAIGDLWADTDDNNRMYISRAVGANEIIAGEWEPFYTATTMNYTRDPNGVNKWLRTRYNISTSGIPYITLIEGQSYAERVLVSDGTSLANGLGDNYIGHLRTLVRKDTAGAVSWTMLHDDGCTVYLDGVLKYSSATYNANASISLGTVPVGLHVLDILWAEQQGGDGIYNISAAIGTFFNELNAPLSVEARTFVQTGIPISTSVGDMWVDTDDGNKTYVAKSAGADAITTGEWELFKSDAVVVTFTQDAIPTSLHIGDMWVDTNDQNKTYIARIVGADAITTGEWELLQSETVGLVAGWKMTGQTTINGGQIATDSITAAQILAGTIGVTKLAVGDTSNLVDINESYAPSVTDTTGNGNPHEITTVSGVRWSRRSATNDTDFYFSNIKQPIPFKDGDRIRVRLNAYSDVATNADVVVHIFDATPTYLRSQTIGSISITTSDTLFSVEADISAATMQNAVRFQFALANLTTGREVRVRSVRAYVMNAGLLVVDGSILTDKLAANAVTADKIQAGAIIAEKLGLGVLRSNMVGDPSFEEDYTLATWSIVDPGNTAQWRKFGGASGSAVRYIGDGRSGATSMHIYTPGQTADPDEDYCVLSPVYYIETGKTYRVIVNATALTANAQLYVEAWTGTTPGNVYSTGSTTTLTGIGSGFGVSVPYVSVVTPSSYGSYSANMTTSANRYCALRVMNWNPAAASTLVVDDISIVEVGQGGASELTAAGLRLFDNLGNEVGAFVTGRPNFFSIAKMVGDQVETIASISAAGTADFTDLAVDADPRVAGFPLLGTTKDWPSPHTDGGLVTGYFDKVSRGLIAYGRGSDASYSSGSIAELSFIAEPGRSYRLSFSGAYGSHSGSGSHGFWIGFATPTSPGGDAAGVTAPAGQYSYKYQSAGGVAGTYPAVSMTVRCNKDGTGYGGELNAGRNRFFIGVDTSVSTSYGWDFTVEDLGPDMPDTYNANTSSQGSSSAPQTYTSIWECNSSDAYTGSANADTSTTDLVQGYYTADKGNQYSLLLFTNDAISGQTTETVAEAMSSATVVKAEVYLYFKHWNEPLGGTAIIRANTLTSLAGTTPSGGSVSSANWPKPGGRWVDITSIWNTSQRGIWLGPGTSTSLLYYGRAASHADSTNKPQLRLTYRK